MSLYDGGGDMKLGGFFVHVRDQFGQCQWAFVTSQAKGSTLNLKVIPNGPDQMIWRPDCAHGAGKGEWHWSNQCAMNAAEIKADDAKSLQETKP